MGGSRRGRPRPRLEVEGLEGRVLLAGDVSVFLDADGNLIIEGDGRANCIELDQFGGFTVRGCDAGGGPTRINGVPNGEVTFGVSGDGDIKIRLRGGDDIVRVGFNSDDVNPPDDLEIDTGEGDDEVRIRGDVNVGDDLEIETGRGSDVVEVSTTTVGIFDDVVIETGDGADEVTIRGGTNIGDDLEIATASGADLVRLPGVMVADDTEIDTDSGADTVFVDESSFGGQFDVETDSGDDFVEICDSRFGGAVDVALGSGDDRLCVGGRTTGSTFEDEDVEFHGGAGKNDRFVIEFSTFEGDPLIGDLIDGFEFDVDDCSFLGGTCF